jgi:hypothetical protein
LASLRCRIYRAGVIANAVVASINRRADVEVVTISIISRRAAPSPGKASYKTSSNGWKLVPEVAAVYCARITIIAVSISLAAVWIGRWRVATSTPVTGAIIALRLVGSCTQLFVRPKLH